MRKILIPGFVVLSVLLAGCSFYTPDIQQGNLLDEKEITKLTTGMTKRQVMQIMGTTLLNDPFHKDRWDYIHTHKSQHSDLRRQRLTLYFENGLLVRIDDSELKEHVFE